MGMFPTGALQAKPQRGDRSHIYLAVAASAHAAAFFGCPTIIVPPRISQQIPAVVAGTLGLAVPLVASLFLLLRYRTRSERVIAWCSFVGSLLWLAVAAGFVTMALRGP